MQGASFVYLALHAPHLALQAPHLDCDMDDLPAQQPEALHIFEHPLAANAAPVMRVPAMDRASIWDKLIMMNLLEGLIDGQRDALTRPVPLRRTGAVICYSPTRILLNMRASGGVRPLVRKLGHSPIEWIIGERNLPDKSLGTQGAMNGMQGLL